MVSSCNCGFLTALTYIINYPEHCTDEKGLEEAGLTTGIGKGNRLFLWFCVLALDPNILKANAYFMTQLWE